MEMVQWSMREEPLKFGTMVHAVTNKHNKLIDTSIKVICNAKYSASCTDILY